MAHFAQLDEHNVVTQVIVVNNNDCLDAHGQEREEIGVAFCQRLFGGNWKQTSYNNNIRKNFAGIGFQYDQTRDAFIEPKPFNSWVLNEDTCRWEAPIPYPQDNNEYKWNEQNQSWDLVKTNI